VGGERRAQSKQPDEEDLEARSAEPLGPVRREWWYGARMNERAFLKNFFQNVTDQPLAAGSSCYVPIDEDESVLDEDPVELLARAIEYSPGQSVQLSGGGSGRGP
jgi:hypothetical protein